MKIGILGGTFDPIHHGHLIIAEYARTSLDLDKILFIPSGIHPLKNNKNISDSQKRLESLKLAIENNSYFEMSTIEIDKENTTYTIDTVRDLKEIYKDDELYFIIGTDLLFEIEKWKDFKELFKIIKFLLFKRPGYDPIDIEEKIRSLKEKHGIEFQKLDSPLVDISSTEIRNRMKKNLSIKYLVPEKVEKYLKNTAFLEANNNGDKI